MACGNGHSTYSTNARKFFRVYRKSKATSDFLISPKISGSTPWINSMKLRWCFPLESTSQYLPRSTTSQCGCGFFIHLENQLKLNNLRLRQPLSHSKLNSLRTKLFIGFFGVDQHLCFFFRKRYASYAPLYWRSSLHSPVVISDHRFVNIMAVNWFITALRSRLVK